MKLRVERLAFGSGLLACLCWACATTLSKSLLARFHPLDLLVVQLSISTAFLWVLTLASRSMPQRSDLRFVWPGLVQPGLTYGLAIFGLAAIPANLETMLFASESAITMMLAWPLLGERPRPAFLVLTAVAFAGVTLLSYDGQSTSTSGVIPIFLTLGGVTCAALYNVSLKHLESGSSNIALTAVTQTSGLAMLVVVWLVWHGGRPPGVPLAELPPIGLSGLLLYGIPFLLFNFTLDKLSASMAGMLLPLAPIMTSVIAYYALGEDMSGIQWIGGATVIIATLVLVLLGDQAPPHPLTDLQTPQISTEER